MAKITILGAGGWAMALAILSNNRGHNVTMWTPFENEIEILNTTRGNEKLLPGVKLPEAIAFSTDISVAENSELTIMAVPSHAVRSAAQKLKAVKNPGIIVDVAKGFDKQNLLRLSEVIKQELPNAEVVALSGPSHAEEVALGVPTSLVAASENLPAAEIVQNALYGPEMRIYTTDDVVGVEIGGAIKNVIAICVGICTGMGLGDNSKAALMTRGLAEMTRLSVCMGGKQHTLAGLTGIGDLIVTCTSQHSRNNRFGMLVGKGVPVKEALSTVGTVEGYYAAELAYTLAKKYRIEMPIVEACYGVLYNGKNIKDCVNSLMCRPNIRE